MTATESVPSKLSAETSSTVGWQFRRVSFATAEPPVGIEFSAGLNVVVTIPEQVANVVAALRFAVRGGDGVHVEFVTDDGAAFVLFRPVGARHRLIGLDDGLERPIEVIDHLALGPDDAPAVGIGALTVVKTLAQLDQEQLWPLAGRLQSAAGHAMSAEPDPASHSGTPASRRFSLLRRARVEVPPPAPLPQAGGDEHRWTELVGAVDVADAWRHRHRITAVAEIPGRLGALSAVGQNDAGANAAPDLDDLVAAVCRVVPSTGERSGPHIVAVPGSIDPDVALLLLEFVLRGDRDQQVVLVTDAEPVLDWARLESYARRATVTDLRTHPGGHLR